MSIRNIHSDLIVEAVAKLCIKANITLDSSLTSSLEKSQNQETSALCKSVYDDLLENIKIADDKKIPICQDTGMAVVFVEIGQDVHIEGELLADAINKGVKKGYKDGFLRKSIVSDPLYNRKNTLDNTPAMIHTNIVKGDKITITVAPKGFGSENMSAIKMLKPSANEDDVVNFVVDTVKNAGGNPCPPLVVGVGIGSDFEGAAILSKKALLRSLDDKNEDENYSKLEERLKLEINKTGIGAMGYKGDITALRVFVNHAPTHIAGLPCAVNISCHCTRHASVTI